MLSSVPTAFHNARDWLLADGSSKLVTSLHATASGSLEAEGHVGVGVRVGKPHATPYQQGLQANVSRNVPAHLRLHQVHHLCVPLLDVCTAVLTMLADATFRV